jgi:xanthine phosphoribosyltransferase
MSISKIDYFNAITSLGLITIDAGNNTLKLFSMIASINHIIPVKYRNNNIVKPLFSQVILQDELHEIFVNIISLLDILPIIDSKYKNFEKLGGRIRQFFILKNNLKYLYEKKYTLFIFSIVSNIIYLFERESRIKNNDRNNFGIFHIFEHIQLYLYLYNNLKHNKEKSKANIIIFALLFGFIIPSLIFKLINIYLVNNYSQRLPLWFDTSLKEIFYKKISKNNASNNMFNYFVKIYSHKLNYNIMNWKSIENKLDTLSNKILDDKFKPDVCIGIASGGAFCLKYLSQKINCNHNFYVTCKVWSSNTIFENIRNTLDYHINYEKYLNDNKKCNITELNGLSKFMQSNKVKNILLFDDTISSGKTIFSVCQYLKTKYPNINLKVATIIIPNKKIGYLANYYVDEDNVPIIWEWGVELD